MADDRDTMATGGAGEERAAAHPARRGVLMLGAVAASSVVTIRPALAQTASSVLNCTIPVPDDAHRGEWIGQNGELVAAGTPGAVASPRHPITGEQARQMMGGATPPGIDPRARDAYVQYIRRLRQGTSGFTCFNSVQMLRP